MRGKGADGDGSAPDDGLEYTRLFTTGLKIGIPWDVLVGMRLPVLVMMVRAAYPPRARKGSGKSVRRATQADIDAFLM